MGNQKPVFIEDITPEITNDQWVQYLKGLLEQVAQHRCCVIKTTGEVEAIDISSGLNLDLVRPHINCGTVGVVRLSPERGGRIMLVDDDGLYEQPHMNAWASAVYQCLCAGQNITPVTGNVVVCNDADFR